MELLPDEDQRDLLLEQLAKLVLAAGPDAFVAAPIVLPDDASFPDRWTPAFESALPKCAYFPFGGGARQCIGEQFAWMEGVLVLATIAQRWAFSLHPTQRIVPQPLVTLRSRYGMRMRLALRAPRLTQSAAGR